MCIDGIYVNDGYVDKDSDSLKMVYVFYTVNAKDSNLEAYSKSMEMSIKGEKATNEYSSEHYKGACDLMPSYYYSEFIEELYIGNSLKVVDVFEIPEGDLTSGKEVTFSATRTRIPDIDQIKVTTDDFIHCASADEIAQKVDSEGYAEEQAKHNPADEETTQAVRNAMNDRYWRWYTYPFSYRIEFEAPNNFTLTKPVTNSGTYEVLEGYVVLTYDSNGPTVEVPWSWENNGEISLDLITVYSFYEG